MIKWFGLACLSIVLFGVIISYGVYTREKEIETARQEALNRAMIEHPPEVETTPTSTTAVKLEPQIEVNQSSPAMQLTPATQSSDSTPTIQSSSPTIQSDAPKITTPTSSPTNAPTNSFSPTSTEKPQTKIQSQKPATFFAMYDESAVSTPNVFHLLDNETKSHSKNQALFIPVQATATTSEPEARRGIPLNANVIVLGYHQFTSVGGTPTNNPYNEPEPIFAWQMAYLRDNGYTVVPMTDLIRFLHGEIGLPQKSVVITIDDGFKSALTVAAPILKRYGYPWTFFIYPDFVGNSANAVSWQDLLNLQADGVDIESHTKSHPFLTKREGKSDAEYNAWLEEQLAGAKQILEQKLNKKIIALAYPYGNWNKTVEAKAVEAGYEAIFTVAGNPISRQTPLTRIGRYVITQPVENLFTSFLRQATLALGDTQPAPGEITSEARPLISTVLGYAGTLDPKSVEAEVLGMGLVPCDFNPATQVVRIYLQRDLAQNMVHVKIHAIDAQSHQHFSASWFFYYEKG